MHAKWTEVVDGGKECSTHEHMHADNPVMATWRFEAGDVGSYYCDSCKHRIDANLTRLAAMQKSHDERAATGTTYQQMR